MNNNFEHQATVDKGLKMKIKRKNVSGANNKAEPKHEIVKTDSKCTSSSTGSSGPGGSSSSSSVGLASSSDPAGSGGGTGATNQGAGGGTGGGGGSSGGTTNTPGSTSGNTTANGVLMSDKMKSSSSADNKQDKSPKMKGSHKKEKVKDKNKNNNNNNNNTNTPSTPNTSTSSGTTTTTTTTTTPSSSSSSLTTSSSSSTSTSLSSSSGTCVATSCPPSSTSSSCPSSAPSSSSSSSSCTPQTSGGGVGATGDCCAVSNGNNNNTNSSSLSSSASSSTTTPAMAAAASIINGLDTSSPVIYSNNNSNTNNNSNNNVNISINSSSSSSTSGTSSMVEPPRVVDVPHLKKENPTPDPYEFNAKVEDGFGIPIKKIKVEKVEAACSPMQPEVHDIGIDTCSVGVITEPECLGPCEPGTSVTLEGIVWHETENAGVLVINVTWRGKTYVGTLLDATKHDWAPPRFNCDSPVSDLESRTPKGRGKRGRGNATPVNERVNSNNSNNSNSSNANNSNNNNEGRKLRKGRRCGGNSFQAPPSPAKPEHERSSSLKRKGRPSDLELTVPQDSSKSNKRCRSSSRGAMAATSNSNNQNSNTAAASSGSLGTTVTIVSSNGSTAGDSTTSPGLLTCPEANCNKQYKHINGLRYHQSHAHHSAMLQAQEAEDNIRDDNTAEDNATDEEIARVRKDESGEMSSAGKESRKVKIKEELTSDDNILADCSTEPQSDSGMHPPSSVDAEIDVTKCGPEKMPIIKIEPNLEVVKTEKVTIKTEHPSSCSGPLPPPGHPGPLPPPGHPINSMSKQSLTTQIYQLAAAPMGCLGSGSVAMVTQTNCQIGPLSSVSTSSSASPVSSQPLPITVSAMGPISHVSESKSDKTSMLDKSKVKTPTRPIVPAPSPQVVAFAGGVGSNHNSLSSVPSTHAQVSPSLKPIQPKPTILGEPMNINPALVGLKDKKAKQKKKCKEKDGVKPGELGPMKGDIPKYERTAVIKAVASPPKPGMELLPKKEGGSLMEPPHLTSDLSRPGALGCGNTVIASSQVSSPKSVDPSHMARMAQPPGLLKVGPSGLLSTPERKTPVNDDVQSPAYSDISDANESGSPSQGDTPVKSKEESASSRKQEKHANQNPSDQAAAPVPHYSMYSYYGQSSYLMPNVSQASSPHVSQSGPSGSGGSGNNSNNGSTMSGHKTPGSVKSEHSSSGNPASAASGHDEKMTINLDEGSSKMIEEKKIKVEKEDPKHKDGAPPGGGGGGGGPGGPSGGPSGPGLPPPEYSQKLFPQYYWPQHGAYQYPYGYMEPYPMHLVPQYSRQYEKVMEDQKRLQQQQQQQHHQGKDVEVVKKPGDYHSKSNLPDESKGPPPHPDLPPNMRPIKSSPHGIALKPTPPDKMTDTHKLSTEKSLERDREQALREKQNENHQILKESIELKPQMDKSRYEMSSLEAYRMHDDMRHSEEMQRYYMFNQQKLIGQEKHKMDFASKTEMQAMESMIPKGSSHKPSDHGRMMPEDLHTRDANSSSTGSSSSNSSSSNSGGGSSSHNPSKRDLADNKNKEIVRDITVIGSKSIPPDMKGDEKQRIMIMDRMRSPAESQKLKSSYPSPHSASGNSGNSNTSIPSSPSTNSGSSSSNSTTAMTTATSSTATTTVASAGSANYPHYLSYPYVQSPAYGQLHFDPYRPFNSVLGYPNPSYLHPTHLAAYRVNPNESEKEEKNPNPPKPIINQPVIGGSELETFKSSEVIHHNSSAPYFGVHKMHELQEKPVSSSRPSPSSSSSNCHSSPHTKSSSISETSVSPSPNFDKSRDYQNSPPTQRHVHTHHHTHVVGTTFPLYPPFTNK